MDEPSGFLPNQEQPEQVDRVVNRRPTAVLVSLGLVTVVIVISVVTKDLNFPVTVAALVMALAVLIWGSSARPRSGSVE